MYKSAIGIFIANIFIIGIIVENNVGPGWEIGQGSLGLILLSSVIIALSLLFSLITFIVGIKQLKIRNVLFKASYFSSLFICLSSLIFLFCVDAFRGQFWFEDFPLGIFQLTSWGIHLLLFTVISIGRFKGARIEK